jgi:hypothetical protein
VECDDNTDSGYCPELVYSYWTTPDETETSEARRLADKSKKQFKPGMSLRYAKTPNDAEKPKSQNDQRLKELLSARKDKVARVRAQYQERADMADSKNVRAKELSQTGKVDKMPMKNEISDSEKLSHKQATGTVHLKGASLMFVLGGSVLVLLLAVAYAWKCVLHEPAKARQVTAETTQEYTRLLD